MNHVTLLGRLTREPDARQTADGKSRCTFTLAIDRHSKKEKTDFIRCVAFGRTAEIITQYVHKGQRLLVSGSIWTDQYEMDGATKYTTDVAVDRMELIERKSDSTQSQGGSFDSMGAPVPVEDEIPF